MSGSVGQGSKSKSEMVVVCHLCSQPGHRKSNCPMKPQRRGHNSRRRKTIQSEENRKRELPFLLTQIIQQRGINAKQSLCKPMESRSQTICFPDLAKKVILASSHGWLVLGGYFFNDEECFLWNPGSKAKINLPNTNAWYHFNKCVLSKAPTEPDCHILFYSTHPFNRYWLSFCKIGDDKYEDESHQLVATASFQGKIYGITNPGYKFVIIDFVGGKMEFRPILMLDREQPFKAPIVKRNWVLRHEIDLINSPFDDELLMVIKDFPHDRNYVHDDIEYRVFRVNVNRMECIEVDDIGYHAILIGYNGNGFCCSSSVANTFKPNSIYYTPMHGPDFYVYDLDEKSTTSCLPPDVGNISLCSINCWVDLKELSC
ncbi:hypothetical protein CASFOL_016131 [Castilleja foliolosa]|uniref:CCHC-type domain-containing protein n=1 Tax=Castilleja foliolosa TaxID=1961234 RepID=A0ABD3DGB7_9LAMI